MTIVIGLVSLVLLSLERGGGEAAIAKHNVMKTFDVLQHMGAYGKTLVLSCMLTNATTMEADFTTLQGYRESADTKTFSGSTLGSKTVMVSDVRAVENGSTVNHKMVDIVLEIYEQT